MSSTEIVPRARPVVPAVLVSPGGTNGRGHDPQEGEEGLDVREALRVLRRNWLLVAAVCLGATAVSGYLAYTRPHQYRSTAVVRMADVRGSLTGGLDGAAAERLGGRRDAVLSQMEVMRSRSLMGSVVDREGLRLRVLGVSGAQVVTDVEVPADVPPDTFHLVFHPRDVEVAGAGTRVRAAYGTPVTVGRVRFAVVRPPAGTAEARAVLVSRDAAINALLSGIEHRERPSTDLFDVSYTAGDPATAQRVLDGIITSFQALNAEQAQQESRRRRVFLQGQLLETDSILAEAQLALSRFRRTQEVYSAREEFSTEQAGMVDLEARREELDAQRRVSRSLLALLERRGVDARTLGALVASPEVSSNPVIVQLYTQLMGYQMARDSLTTGQFRSPDDSPQVQRLNSLIASTETRITDAVRSQVTSVEARIAALEGLSQNRAGRLQKLPDVEVEEVRLTQQVAVTQTVADQLRAELQRARIAEAVEVGQVEVVDPASRPGAPVPQNRPLRLMMGLLMGLTLGVGGALVREHMNTSIVRREELEQLLKVSSLAVIPGLSQNGRGNGLARFRRRALPPPAPGASVLAASDPRAPVSEAYRTLRTNLLFSQTSRLKLLVVTSAGPAEGKTTTSCNLAATFAQQGMSVVLVDCDLRRPRVHEVFGAEREPGLTQFMLGYCTADEAVRKTDVERLFVVPSGTLPPNPSELLGSGRMGEVLAELQARFDLVILDTPPVLLAPDASIVAANADGVLMVVRAGVTDRGAARDAAQQLAKVGAHLVGGVLNDPEGKTQHGYQAYYSYHRYGYGPAAV